MSGLGTTPVDLLPGWSLRAWPLLGAPLAGLGLLLAPAPLAAAGDPDAGREKAHQCAVCHGIEGVAKRPDAPNIGGESELYLEKQLQAFRSGERRHEQMSIIAAGLSDQDIADLVAWYASLDFEVRLPE